MAWKMSDIAAAAAAVLIAAFSAQGAAAAAAPFGLRILHTNDTHSYAAGFDDGGIACERDEGCRGGYARIAAAVHAEREKGGNVLFLDAGDRWQGTLFFATRGSELIEYADKALGWDAATLGNHEFDKGCGAAAKYVDESSRSVPMLAANLALDPSCPLSRSAVLPWITRDIGGRRVGIFGIANDEVVEIAHACPHTTFLGREEAARRAVRELKAQGASIIIAVTHIGYEADRSLARSVSGIDVIVGGHTHTLLGPGKGAEGPYPTLEVSPAGEPVLVVTAWHHTGVIGRLEAAFDERGVITGWNGSVLELDSGQPRDKSVEAYVEEASREVAALKRTKVAENCVVFCDGLNPCREGDCLSGMLAADAFLAFGRQYGATASLVNGGSLRHGLPLGAVTRGDLLEALPFGNSAAVADIPGRVIRMALEHGVDDVDVIGPRLLQAAGLRYEVDRRGKSGSRIVRVEARDDGGAWQPLDDSRSYRVVMPAFLADGGDGYSMIPAAAEFVPVRDVLEVEILADHLARIGVIGSVERGRIRGLRESEEEVCGRR